MEQRLKTVLICHHDAPLHRVAMARWLGSFSDLTGIVEIHEPRARLWRRVRRELRRVGALRFLDVLAYRAWDRLTLAAADRRWEAGLLARLGRLYGAVPVSTPVHVTTDPNSAATVAFIRERAPDLALAACKIILRPALFSIPPRGTFVVHPGICPEYRNAHGCFWALARDDGHNVGATLLKVDAGVDTGPVYGYFRYPYDASRESPFMIQSRVVFDNLDQIRATLLAIGAGRASPLDTSTRRSATWGQPRLSAYIGWKRLARRRRAGAYAAVS
ncbi:MAG TPA: formyltransferase family protein [Gemmatimonadales bacterium]|nr:formyltransferase family protein [Gemmatimonadales bacterium]